MRTWKIGWMMFLAAVLMVSATPAIAQEHGESGGGGCGDVFGDLIHILRDDLTGQPILAQRWIELPAEVPGYGWGYCPIAVTADGQEIPFLPYTCDLDIDPLSDNFVGPPVEVNYFGRLNGGRTKPRNNRMHFDEVISNIKAGMMVKRGPAGRLMIGYDCEDVGMPPCDEWATVDSPMENMGLYVRLMKFGHLATDPYEIDIWAHGDPKLPTQFHPALGVEDWPKFHNTVEHMLPSDGDNPEYCWDYDGAEDYTDVNEDGVWNPAEPFIDINKDGYHDDGEPFTDLDLDGEWDAAEPFIDTNDNGLADEFTFLCADQEQLGNRDFVSVAAFLGAAASKTGKVTWDLVQYWNRILKVTKTNEYTGPLPLNTLPALYRDCWEGPDPEDPPEVGDVLDPDYLTGDECDIVPVDSNQPEFPPPNYDLFTDLKERFVDFEGLDDYEREGEEIEAIKSTSEDTWALADDVSLIEWVELVNGVEFETGNIAGFVNAAIDFLRMIEFIHNYDPPVDLFCTYETANCGVYE